MESDENYIQISYMYESNVLLWDLKNVHYSIEEKQNIETNL